MNQILKELRRHKGRAVSGISGYAVASLFIMLVLSVTGTGRNDSVGILKTTGTHFIVYLPSPATCCPSPKNEVTNSSLVAEGIYTQMLNSDLLTSVREIDGVRDASPYLLYRIFDEKYKSNIALGGIDTGRVATRNNVCSSEYLVAGKYLSGKQDEVVAEQSFAEAHGFSPGDTLDTYGGKLVLSGIINSGIKPGKADLYAPIESVRGILKDKMDCISSGYDMNIILVEVGDAGIQNRVIGQIRERMSYLAVSSFNCYQPASRVMSIMDGTSRMVTMLIFIFLIIFSAKTQTSSFMERFREIGILKSLGWSDLRLTGQLLLMSLIQSLAGAFTGICLGWFLIHFMNSQQFSILNMMEFQIAPWNIPLIFLMCLSGGLIAGIFPVVKLHRARAGEMINNYM